MSAPAWSAILEVQDPDGRRSRHPFRHPRVQVGRRRDNDLSLGDEAVSHQHCEFVSEQGFFVVRDLGSHNGTFVNERRVGEARLRDGDEVRIGGTRIKVALQGRVRRPPGVRWGRIALALLALAGLFAALLPLWQREHEKHARYVDELRHTFETDACGAMQFAQLVALDSRTAGHSFVIGSISPKEREANEELLALFRKKLEIYPGVLDELTHEQQAQRESLERASRLGQRFISTKDRKLAKWAEGLLERREKSANDLAQGVRAAHVETARLVGWVEAVVVRHESAQGSALEQFRFVTDLGALKKACDAESERSAVAAVGALNALE